MDICLQTNYLVDFLLYLRYKIGELFFILKANETKCEIVIIMLACDWRISTYKISYFKNFKIYYPCINWQVNNYCESKIDQYSCNKCFI